MKTKFLYEFFSTLVVLVITFLPAKLNLIYENLNTIHIPDDWHVISQSQEYVNRIFIDEESPGPDLIPTIPPIGDWLYPLVASQMTGDHMPDNPLSTSSPVYIDFAIRNQGFSTSQPFTTCVFVNNFPAYCWKKNGLGENETFVVNDWQLPLNFVPRAGLNQFKLVIDVYDDVSEVDETNNVFPKPTSPVPEDLPYQYVWSIPSVVDLLPAIPEGWIYPIQPLNSSHIPGPLFAGQDTYVSVAVQNLSFAQSAPFSICLFFDASDSPQHCWNSDSGLLPQAALILENAILDSALVPTPGQHFIKLVIDPDNRVQEANEINNIWFRSYYWQEAGTCGPISSSGLTQSNLPPDPWVAQDLFIPTAPALLPDTLLPATIQQDSSTNLYRVALNPGSANQTRPKTAVRAPVLQTTDSKNEWQLVLYEDFEGSFPEDNGWSLVNTTPELCEYLWDSDQTRYAPPTGSHAGWPARGGRNGVSPASSKYPPNTRSWMIYGPFSLEKAADARLTFDLWRDLEAPYDSLFAGASKDGIIFDGVLFSDEGGWAKKQIDLDQYSGSSLVWIAFLFTSDPSGQFTGPWVDNILVEQEIKPKQIYLPVIAR